MRVGNIVTSFRPSDGTLIVIFVSRSGQKSAYLFSGAAADAVEAGGDPAAYTGLRIPVAIVTRGIDMSDELKMIARRLNAAFVSDPSATRQALVEALPAAIRALASIATGTEYKASARMKAVNELLKLQARVVREDLQRATAAVRRREVEVAAIEARVKLVEAKTAQDFEARQKRKALAKAGRVLTAAKKIPDAT